MEKTCLSTEIPDSWTTSTPGNIWKQLGSPKTRFFQGTFFKPPFSFAFHLFMGRLSQHFGGWNVCEQNHQHLIVPHYYNFSMLSRFCNRDRIKKKESASRLKPILHHLCSRTQTFDCNTVLNRTGGDASWVELRSSTTLIKLAHSFLTCTSDSAVYKIHHRSHR